MTRILSLDGVPIAEIDDRAADQMLDFRRKWPRDGSATILSVRGGDIACDVSTSPAERKFVVIEREATVTLEIAFSKLERP
jgi:hypothetical protein